MTSATLNAQRGEDGETLSFESQHASSSSDDAFARQDASPSSDDDEFEKVIDFLSFPQVRTHLMGPLLNISQSTLEARDWDKLYLYVPRRLIVRGSRSAIAQSLGAQATRGYVAFNLYIPKLLKTSYTVVMDLFGEDVTVLPMGLRDDEVEMGGLVPFGIDALKAFSSDSLLVGLNQADGRTSSSMTEKGPALRLDWRNARDLHGSTPTPDDWTKLTGHSDHCSGEAHDVQYDGSTGALLGEEYLWKPCAGKCGCSVCPASTTGARSNAAAGGSWGTILKVSANTSDGRGPNGVLGRWELPGTTAVNHLQVFEDDQRASDGLVAVVSDHITNACVQRAMNDQIENEKEPTL